jgi:Fic-DOC domain mobile mystery protein B
VIVGLDNNDGKTPLDPDELEGLKHPHVTVRGQIDQLEQVNIQDAMIWLGRQKNPDILSDGFTRQLHRRMLGDVWAWAGTYRLTEKNIGVDPRQISARLLDLLSDVRYWIAHETYPPLEIALRFHHRLVYIHPFTNGNGRFARIITDELLRKVLAAEPVNWSGGYDMQAMSERRDQYIAALRTADGGDYSALFEFAGYSPSTISQPSP